MLLLRWNGDNHEIFMMVVLRVPQRLLVHGDGSEVKAAALNSECA
jgi:hypothetical protein